jgi:hypothetical protein
MSEVSMNRVFRCCNKAKPDYNKLKTGGNDPSITKAQRLSQYVNTTKPSIRIQDTQTYLDNKGLIYMPITYNVTSYRNTNIDNDIIFPREKIFL